MTLVVDASVIVAALVDSGAEGAWAEEVVGSEGLAAPHLMPVEAANILRLAAQAGDISQDVASLAHTACWRSLSSFSLTSLFARRVWELRGGVTAYDAWYVALAEALAVRLATLDRRLTRAAGPRCAFSTFVD